jgi:hypothetical protein
MNPAPPVLWPGILPTSTFCGFQDESRPEAEFAGVLENLQNANTSARHCLSTEGPRVGDARRFV